MKTRELTKAELLANIEHAKKIKREQRQRAIMRGIKHSGFLGQSVLPNGFNLKGSI